MNSEKCVMSSEEWEKSLHILVTGKSGSGKSTTLRKMIEEIKEEENTSLFIMDAACEHIKIESGKEIIGCDEVVCTYGDIPREERLEMLCGGSKYPEDRWLANWMDRKMLEKGQKKEIIEKYEEKMLRWREGRVKKDEKYENGEEKDIRYRIKNILEAEAVMAIVEGIKNIMNNKEIVLEGDKSTKKNLNDVMKDDYIVQDMMSYGQEGKEKSRKMAIEILRRIWNQAENEYIEMVRKNTKEENKCNEVKKRYVIIEEAHNIVGQGEKERQEKEMREIIRTMAAEGRKPGIRLVLVTQRIDKIDEKIMSEVTTYVINEVTCNTAEEIRRRIKIDEKHKLEELNTNKDKRKIVVSGDALDGKTNKKVLELA